MSIEEELDDLFCRKRNYDFRETMLLLADFAKLKRVEIHVTTSRDGTEITVEPWEPYQPTCPYARQRCAEEATGDE